MKTEISVRCSICNHDLIIEETHGRLGEIVIRVENCYSCIEAVKDESYNKGASDGYAQCEEDREE